MEVYITILWEIFVSLFKNARYASRTRDERKLACWQALNALADVAVELNYRIDRKEDGIAFVALTRWNYSEYNRSFAIRITNNGNFEVATNWSARTIITSVMYTPEFHVKKWNHAFVEAIKMMVKQYDYING